MSAHFSVQPSHSTGVYFDQASRALDATAIGQMFSYQDGFRLWYLAIPQGRVFPFAEFLLTATAAQIAYLVLTVHFSDCQIGAPFLAIQVAVGVDTC
jgi:hypothetical protein